MSFLHVPVVRSELILNTPERKEILSGGPTKVANCNILGKGAYGTVFEAVFRDRPVAVKVVKNRAGVNRTDNEAHILGWKQRHIIRILKVESTVNFGIIIMEHFAGKSLQFVLDSMELPFVHKIFISLDVLSALLYCHKRGLLHLDVKPQNILIAFKKQNKSTAGNNEILELLKQRSYICKLCDFGSSMLISEQELGKIKSGGTIRYMSPEALQADTLSPAADIYSLGITMWQLQERRIPYYQIQCNEVVAFQVVKYGLRPDSVFQHLKEANNKKYSGNGKEMICLCQHNKTASSSILKKRLQLNISDVKPMRRSCLSAEKAAAWSTSISPNVRVGKENRTVQCNISKNVVRNLAKDLQIDDNERRRDHGSSYNYSDIFSNSYYWKNDVLAAKEQHYCQLFKCCWQASDVERTNGVELYKQLFKLLE